MSKLQNVKLGRLGAEFVDSRLSAGGALSQAVFEALGPVRNAFALLPPGVSTSPLTNFETGGLASYADAVTALASELGMDAAEQAGSLALVEDSWAKMTDVPTATQQHRVAMIDADCLVYGLRSADADTEALTRLLKRVTSFDFNGFVLHTPGQSDPFEGGITTLDAARRTSWSFVSAFDREGLIFANWA